eukprot:CAMPEP_0203934120 /NCGR_PEP_ID=MMETSP0359-20131031/72154_1 /ASSEMBLY_ACC=CAM_ASM_000338 /TAXON_ID=268821 /ORGANISM="Scrippsiella Hangoei, Strain SHTV-5" /LENGTH=45 /DNA_ID= /DNA_START= /DNA_END= /DNA_ORIENTATION=
MARKAGGGSGGGGSTGGCDDSAGGSCGRGCIGGTSLKQPLALAAN